MAVGLRWGGVGNVSGGGGGCACGCGCDGSDGGGGDVVMVVAAWEAIVDAHGGAEIPPFSIAEIAVSVGLLRRPRLNVISRLAMRRALLRHVAPIPCSSWELLGASGATPT